MTAQQSGFDPRSHSTFALCAALAAMAITYAGTAAGDPSPAEARLNELIQNGKLVIEPKFEAPLDLQRKLSLVRAELAPGVTEQRHTHPGMEVLYGLQGTGFVEIDGQTKVPIGPGSVVQIKRQQVKAIINGSQNEPLSVLAVLVLDTDKPPVSPVD